MVSSNLGLMMIAAFEMVKSEFSMPMMMLLLVCEDLKFRNILDRMEASILAKWFHSQNKFPSHLNYLFRLDKAIGCKYAMDHIIATVHLNSVGLNKLNVAVENIKISTTTSCCFIFKLICLLSVGSSFLKHNDSFGKKPTFEESLWNKTILKTTRPIPAPGSAAIIF